MPSAFLAAARSHVARLLRQGDLLAAVRLVDQALLLDQGLVTADELQLVRTAHAAMTYRRVARADSGR